MKTEPHVSVVIVNWNYGRYVREAIESVKNQTYQNFSCFIVDNGSDDGSPDIIADAIQGCRQFTLHRLPGNLGQLGGSYVALSKINSDYVTFLDADDIFFPEFLASHVQVHIGTAHPTGFTSSSQADINADGELLTGGNSWMHRCWKECGEPSMRDVDNAIRIPAFDKEAYSALAERTRYLPSWIHGWRWSPGSSNVYRRAMLERVRPKVAPGKVLGGVDGFYTPILHAITGTNLIDRPLNAYRIHGANDFSRLPGLVGVLSSYGEAEERSYSTAQRSLLSLIDGVDEILKTVASDRYWHVLDTTASVSRRPQMFSDPIIAAGLVRQYTHLASIFGESALLRELLRRMPRRRCLQIVFAARKGKQAASSLSHFSMLESKRILTDPSRRLVQAASRFARKTAAAFGGS